MACEKVLEVKPKVEGLGLCRIWGLRRVWDVRPALWDFRVPQLGVYGSR